MQTIPTTQPMEKAMYELAVPITEYVRPNGRKVMRDIVVPEHQFKWVGEYNVKLSFEHDGRGTYITYFDVGWRINDDEFEDPDELITITNASAGFVSAIDRAMVVFAKYPDRKRFNIPEWRTENGRV